MEVIYINNPVQDENTKEPQLIDGKLFHWSVYPVKLRGTLNDELNKLRDRGKVKYFLIHDVKSVNRYFCDQGCKIGEGCKKDYSPDDHALRVSYATIIETE